MEQPEPQTSTQGRRRGRPRTNPELDTWHGVLDARSRKRIQDRLAQRARRAREQQINTDGEASESNVVSLTSSSSPSEASGRSIPNTPLTSDYRYLHWPAWPIYHALVEHGLMFDTDCPAATSEGVPTVQYLSLPVSLRPSPLQLAQSHPRWIDRFPFPRLRDNMILLRALVDLHEFVGDLFSFPGLTRCESGPTWEPAVWRMSNDFAAKWGYLFR